MRTIVHLSDLHFGRADFALIDPLLERVHELRPDITAVSGDFTQNGTYREFSQASEFVKRLPGLVICVPGNHDMAFLNVWKRATQRLRLFRELISHDPEPFYADDELAMIGLNTARITHLRDGRIREWQIIRLEERMNNVAPQAVKVLVTHHPFDLPSVFASSEIVGHGAQFMKRVTACIDLLLAGHMHISHAGPTAQRYDVGGDSAVFVQAGTALSTRMRGEENSFQLIRIAPGAIEVQQYITNGTQFMAGDQRLFRDQAGGWMPVSHSLATDGSNTA